MSVNLDEIRANLRTKALAVVAQIAADGDPKPSAVEQALVVLGASFDAEMSKAKARLKLAAAEAEMPALRAAMDAAGAEAGKAHDAKEALEAKHRTEKDAAEIEFRDKWMRSNQAQAAVNKVEYRIRDLTAEIGS